MDSLQQHVEAFFLLPVHKQFEIQAQKTPQAPALISGSQKMTYAELNRRTNQLAYYLQKKGVGRDVPVGLCLGHSFEAIVGILGILKAGGAYVPLDPTYPARRMAYILKDVQAAVLLTQQRFKDVFSASEILLVCLDTEQANISQQSQENIVYELSADNLAYVIYTSGSTGKPKGVMVAHRGLANYVSWSSSAYQVSRGSGSLLYSPLTFDLPLTALFPSLVTGVPVRFLTDVWNLGEALQSNWQLSVVKLTPAHLKILSYFRMERWIQGRIQTLVIGGEALSAESLRFWHQYASGTRLINEYGPTETVVGCCVYEIPPDGEMKGPVPIGSPILNTQMYIVNEQFQPQVPEEPGELYIGGEGIARGYLNQPELTAERFVPDPFSGKSGARLYRTGDLARFLSDGTIVFLGRIDQQVKIRGLRIELEEIEAVLNQHPIVHACVVVAREDEPGDQRLVAYIVPHLTSSTANQDVIVNLRTYLQGELPDHMLPSAFVLLESLPLTPNGKFDRKFLLASHEGSLTPEKSL